MKIHCLLQTSEYRGDHSADVARAVTIQDGETVEHLVNRLLVIQKREGLVYQTSDVIELRVENLNL